MTLALHDDFQSDDNGPSKKTLKPSLEDIYAALDAAGAADFTQERNFSTAHDRELF